MGWDGMDGRLSPFDGMLRAPTVLIIVLEPLQTSQPEPRSPTSRPDLGESVSHREKRTACKLPKDQQQHLSSRHCAKCPNLLETLLSSPFPLLETLLSTCSSFLSLDHPLPRTNSNISP